MLLEFFVELSLILSQGLFNLEKRLYIWCIEKYAKSLNNLVDKELVTKVVRQDKIAYYEIANEDSNKHYMICDTCNNAYTTDVFDVDKIARKIKRETGFYITSHTLEFHGMCPECKNKNAH